MLSRLLPQAYGSDHLPLLLSLERLNLLVRPPTVSRSAPKPPFAVARKPLRLIVDDVDETNPSDVSYVFSGYAPLGVRLVQCALGGGADSASAGTAAGTASGLNGWRGLEEVVKALPGATLDERQPADDGARRRASLLRTLFALGGAS